MKIRFIPDLHYCDSNDLKSGDRIFQSQYVHRIFDGLFDTKADIYLSIGDLVTTGTIEEAEQIYTMIDSYGKPFTHIFGNHELRFTRRTEWPQRYNICNKSMECDGVKIIFLDTPKEFSTGAPIGHIPQETKEWLEKEIISSGTKPLVIFAHHGVYDTTSRTDRVNGSIDPEDNIQAILAKKIGPAFYIHGHNHGDSIVHQNNWTYIQAGAELDRATVREVIVDQTSLTYTTEVLDDPFMLNIRKKFVGKISAFATRPMQVGTSLESNLKVNFE